MRLLVLVLVAVFVWLALESLWKEIRERLAVGQPGSKPSRKESQSAERLIQCARCGVYIPLSRAHREGLEQGVCRECLEPLQEDQDEPKSRAG